MDNFNIIVNGGQQSEDLVMDGWTDIMRKLSVRGTGVQAQQMDPKLLAERRQLTDFEKMESIRARVDSIIRDPETAEQLKPYYNQFCKRPCFHDEHLPTFNCSNVRLVDTNGVGVQAITEKGVIANDEEFELDCLIYATGFELATSWSQRSGIEITGRNGLSLNDKWSDGPNTLHGFLSSSFPNCFFVSIMQTGFLPNFLHMTGAQAEHISYIIKRCAERSIRTVEPTPEAEKAWVQLIVDAGQRRRAFNEQCTPGYYNNEGIATNGKSSTYGGSALEYVKIIRGWREKDNFEGLDVQYLN